MPVLVVDASEYSIGAVLEQQQHPMICISRRLKKAEYHYSQTQKQKETLAIYWTVKRLHKYLYGVRFKIISDHRALQHIFSPAVSVGKSTSIMLQRWAMDLSAYDYEIAHRPGKQIPHADYLSRHAYHTPPDDDTTVLMVNPLSVHRNQPIKAAREAYRSILSALKHGWSISAKKNIPQIYAQREIFQYSQTG